MYVLDLDRPWLETPFLFQGFEIRSQDDIAELQRYCKYVYIDVPESSDISPHLHAREKDKVPYSIQTGDREKNFEYAFLKITNRPRNRPLYPDQTTLEEEICAVREHHDRTRELIYTVMQDIRLGRNIQSLDAKKVVGALTESVIRNPDALICFIQLKKKDEYTALHSLRVCILALAFGRHLGLEKEELNVLGIGALLHDMGKMKVPNEILNKPGALDEREFEIMKSHVPRGVEIVEQAGNIPPAAVEVVRCHHERYNGRGYVSGLKGEQIGLFGTIGAVVDCYDAISSDRAYRGGMSTHTALRKMYEWRNKDFHPKLVEQFIQCMGIYPIGSVVELNTGEIGVVVTMNRVRRLKPRVTLVLQPNASPYPSQKTVDLMQHKTRDGRPCEIERVLEPGTYGINPTHYLPVSAASGF